MNRPSAAVRRQVRERAGNRCEYCRMPDRVSGAGFQIDHIISQKHGGSSFAPNFAYACLKCNQSKGSDIAAYDDDTKVLTPLYNPRNQIWDEHFQLKDAVIAGKSAIGRVTIWVLQMNHPRQVEARAELIDAGLW